MKLFVVNVGVNKTDAQQRGLKSPIFRDGTFEFIPIKESINDSKFATYKYSGIKCYNDPDRKLAYYLPGKLYNYFAHNDPEFVTFTYGDIFSSRAGNLKYAKKGDLIFFLARLYEYSKSKNEFAGKSDFYFIGYLSVQNHFEFSGNEAFKNQKDWRVLKKNAHFIKYRNGLKEKFRVIKGDPKKSFRFLKALKIDPKIVEILYDGKYDAKGDVFFSNKDDSVIKNKSNNKPKRYSNFHSNTRTIQHFLDDKIKSEKKCTEKLLSIVRDSCF